MKQRSTSCNHFGNLQINSNHGSLKSKVGLIQSLQAADVWQMLCCDVVRQKCRLTSSRICPNLQKFLGTSVDDGHPCIQHSNMCCRTYPFENGARICLNWPKVWLHEEAPAESVVDNDGSRWLWWRHEESSCIIELTIIDHPYPGFFSVIVQNSFSWKETRLVFFVGCLCQQQTAPNVQGGYRQPQNRATLQWKFDASSSGSTLGS